MRQRFHIYILCDIVEESLYGFNKTCVIRDKNMNEIHRCIVNNQFLYDDSGNTLTSTSPVPYKGAHMVAKKLVIGTEFKNGYYTYSYIILPNGDTVDDTTKVKAILSDAISPFKSEWSLPSFTKWLPY